MATPKKETPITKKETPNSGVLTVITEDPSVKVLSASEDKIRTAVKVINNIIAHLFDFKQSPETLEFFKAFKLTPTGSKTGPTPPKFIYDVIKEEILDKLYDVLSKALNDAFEAQKLNQSQLFKQLISGLKIKTYNAEAKKIIDDASKEFETNLKESKFIDYVYDNPQVLIPGKRVPKLKLLTGGSNQFYDSDPIIVDKQKIINFLKNEYEVKYPGKQIPGFSIENLFAYKIVSADIKTSEDYIKKVIEIYTSYQNQFKKFNGNSAVQIVSSINIILNSLNDILNFIQVNDNKIKLLTPPPGLPQDFIKDKKDLYNFIFNYGTQQKSFIALLEKIVIEQLQIQSTITPPKLSANDFPPFKEVMGTFKTILIDPLVQQTNDRYDKFIKYYTELNKKIDLEVKPYLILLEKYSVKFPIYSYSKGLVNPKYYSPYPDLDVDLLYDKQVDIYKNKNPKLLFTFTKPQLLSHEPISTPILNKEGKNNYKASNEQKLFNALQPTKIFVYKANYEITNLIPDLVNEGNLFKELNVLDDELSFYDLIEPNKNYYYFYVAKFTAPTDETIYNIDENFVIISGEDLYWIGSPILKINLVRDSNFYYLETKTLTEKSFKINKYEESFKNKISIIPKSKPFNYGGDSFTTGQSNFIKIRTTSTKTRKKVDLNLKYTIGKNKKVMNNDEFEKSKPDLVETLDDPIIKKLVKDKFVNEDVTQTLKTIIKSESLLTEIESASDLKIALDPGLNSILGELFGSPQTQEDKEVNLKKLDFNLGKLFPKKN